MEASIIAPLANLSFPSPCRLLSSACCPDKDLVVLISRLGAFDRLSLWKIQGGKKWEVDVCAADSTSSQVVDVFWSPDGQSIAVAHDPPAVTIHSIQDGHEERVLPLSNSGPAYHLTSMRWFTYQSTVVPDNIPDIFKRNDVITGSAHSILKILPLLDNLPEDSEKLVPTDIFAAHGSNSRARKASVPDVIKQWPTLKTDHLAASMSSPIQTQTNGLTQDDLKQSDNLNKDSMLTLSDNLCRFHSFLDGTFPLGIIALSAGGGDTVIHSLQKDPKSPIFFAHPQMSVNANKATDLLPTRIHLPMLEQRHIRDLANLSSSSRELLWYVMRCVKEMRTAWFGSDIISGARELGPKWIQALEAKQKDDFGQEEPNPMLDLTALLATGRPSDSLADFLGSGELMSDRGIQKWDSTMTEALSKLRDYSEKRVAPACQRLHLLLEEVHGWSLLPHYKAFELPPDELKACLTSANRAIVLATWLTAIARRELGRFGEFMNWIRTESSNANPSETNSPSLRYDILEVNKYLTAGLVVSSIDKWFMGPVPQFDPQDLGMPGKNKTMAEVIKRARNVAKDSTQTVWQHNVRPKDLNHLDRNMDALVQELAARCSRLFDHASQAAARSAQIMPGEGSLSADLQLETGINHLRERILTEQEISMQYVAGKIPQAAERRAVLCVTRQHYGEQARIPIEVALLECCLYDNGTDVIELELLAIDFFDDQCLVIVYRIPAADDQAWIATVDYRNLAYHEVGSPGNTREYVMLQATQNWQAGMIPCSPIPIKQSRLLIGCRTGEVSLSVNGRVGRRVACVLDCRGTSMETLDMEAEPEEEAPEIEENVDR